MTKEKKEGNSTRVAQQAGKNKKKTKTKAMNKKRAMSKTIAKPRKKTAVKVGGKKKALKKRSVTALKKTAIVKKRKVAKKTVSRKRKVVKNKIAVPEKIGGMRTAAFGYLVAGIFELVMSIPLLGWLMGVSSFGVMWVSGIIINIIVIIALLNRRKPIYANMLAIVANILGIMPFVGWFLHLIAMILLFSLFIKEERT